MYWSETQLSVPVQVDLLSAHVVRGPGAARGGRGAAAEGRRGRRGRRRHRPRRSWELLRNENGRACLGKYREYRTARAPAAAAARTPRGRRSRAIHATQFLKQAAEVREVLREIRKTCPYYMYSVVVSPVYSLALSPV